MRLKIYWLYSLQRDESYPLQTTPAPKKQPPPPKTPKCLVWLQTAPNGEAQVLEIWKVGRNPSLLLLPDLLWLEVVVTIRIK